MNNKRKIDWSLHGQQIIKLYVEDLLSTREIIKKIKSLYDVEYKSGTLTNFLGRSGVLRSQSEAHALVKSKRRKNCNHCLKQYNPSSYNQRWCDTCTGAGRYKRRLSAYGLTAVELEAMLEEQGRACAVCKKVFESAFNANRRKTLYVDHDHETSRVRGLVCPRCNLGLSFMDNKDWHRNALAYKLDNSDVS